MYVYVCAYSPFCIYQCAPCVSLYVCMCIHVYRCMYVCVYMCFVVCMYVYTCVCGYMYIYVEIRKAKKQNIFE